MTPLLSATSVSVRYGGVTALDDVSVELRQGSIVGLIGPNGAGKTTFLDAVTGFVECDGRVEMDGTPIDGMAAHRRVHHGLSRTFQSLELFEDLSVRDNLLVSGDRGQWWSVFVDVVKPTRKVSLDAVNEALELVGLTDHVDVFPTALSHGQRKLVAVARALAARPRALLLDEPAAGLDSAESRAFGLELRRLVEDHGIGILLVDHDMGLVLNVCDDVYVLDFGRLIARGTPAEVRQNPDVVAAYLGGQAEPDGAALAEEIGTSLRLVADAAVTSAPDEEPATPAVVEVRGLTSGYNGVPVVRDVNLSIGRGEVVALLGPNGAGKTTTLATIAGLVPAIAGEVALDGDACIGVAPHVLARRGLALVPEDRAIAPSLSVRESLALVRGKDRRQMRELVVNYFPALGNLLDRRVSTLSGGEQQMLAIALALASSPRVLMVDEMSLGLAPVIVQRLLPTLRDIANDIGTAVLLVEQHIHLALEYSDRAYVLSHGDLVLEGRSEDLLRDRDVLESSYLGARVLA